jgi:nicotinate phosphoribosyltransferase
LRIDTHGGRYVEGLDRARSYTVLERHAPHATRGYHTDEDLRHLIGTGLSAAAVWLLRQTLTRPVLRRSRSSPAPASARRIAG